MSHVATRALIDDVTIWTAGVPDGFGGRSIGVRAVGKCRWEDRNETFINVQNQQEEISRAVVFLDRDVQPGDWIYHGVSAAADPATVPTAYQVRRFDKVPNRRNLLAVRKVFI
jgi:hypothetical protein